MKVFAGLAKRKGQPKVTGRPPKTSTLADLAPLPKGMQTTNPIRAKVPKVPKLPTAGGKF